MLVTNASVLPLIAHRRLTSENERVRFWIALFLALVIGAAGTIAYYVGHRG
jgi:hypothetical protein